MIAHKRRGINEDEALRVEEVWHMLLIRFLYADIAFDSFGLLATGEWAGRREKCVGPAPIGASHDDAVVANTLPRTRWRSVV